MLGELRNLRVHNRLSSQLLSRLLALRHWNELKLAERSGIARSVVSAHLYGQRPIRPQHLTAYLRALDRDERAAFLSTWLRDSLDHELITDLLDGTKTDSMPALEENRRRMLDWWATAIARDSKLAKTFSHLITGLQFPSVLLLPVSTAAAQFQSWLLGKASSVWYLVRSLCSRVEHAAVALVTLLLGLCQQGKVSQQAGELAGELAEKTVATSLVATSFVAPALAETTEFNFDLGDASPPPPAIPDIRKGKVASRPIVKRGLGRAQPQYQVGPALRVEKTIHHEWRRLVAARKSVHSAFVRLIRDAHPQQSKQKHRKQRRG